jgi:hypothetical protein
LESLRAQSFTRFDLLMVNDGCSDLQSITGPFADLRIVEMPFRGTPAQNREHGLKSVLDGGYEFVVFGDSDDYFAADRVELSVNRLHHYDVVVNDLSLVTDGKVTKSDYFSNRIEDGFEIELDFIRDKNLFGLSNTAVRTSALSGGVIEPALVAVDWYLFSTLLLKQKRAVFTNVTTTFYRQHGSNIVGMGQPTRNSFARALGVKTQHYNAMRMLDESFEAYYRAAVALQAATSDGSNVDDILAEVGPNPFWWEECTCDVERPE